MNLSPLFTALAAIVVSATVACTGNIDDGTGGVASADPAARSLVEQTSDPAGEGEETAFAAPAPAAAPGTSGEAPKGEAPKGEAPKDEARKGEGEGEGGAPRAAPSAPPAPSEPTTPPVERLVKEATREITVMKVTAYEHTTSVDEPTGTFKYDCSGFVGYALSRVLPEKFAAVQAFGAVARPLAKHYQTFFASIATGATKSGWSSVARAIDTRPGDVVAWITPVDLVSTNTGHVMIVTGPPTINPKRADEILIPITDSTSSFHGPSDTRAPSSITGLGRGTIGIIVDAKGTAVRYRWTGGYSAKEYSTAISFGRPI